MSENAIRRLIFISGALIINACTIIGLAAESEDSQYQKLAYEASALNYTLPESLKRLSDGQIGTEDELSWQHSVNPWDEQQYEMSLVLILDESKELSKLRYHVGNLPELESAALNIYIRDDPESEWVLAGVTTDYATAWNKWHSFTFDKGTKANYVKLSFNEKGQRFNISELELLALPDPEPQDAPNVGAMLKPAPKVRGPRVKKPSEFVQAIKDPDLVP